MWLRGMIWMSLRGGGRHEEEGKMKVEFSDGVGSIGTFEQHRDENFGLTTGLLQVPNATSSSSTCSTGDRTVAREARHRNSITSPHLGRSPASVILNILLLNPW